MPNRSRYMGLQALAHEWSLALIGNALGKKVGTKTIWTRGVFDKEARRKPHKPPDLIITDIRMPIMSGFEAATKIRDAVAQGSQRTDVHLATACVQVDLVHACN